MKPDIANVDHFKSKVRIVRHFLQGCILMIKSASFDLIQIFSKDFFVNVCMLMMTLYVMYDEQIVFCIVHWLLRD